MSGSVSDMDPADARERVSSAIGDACSLGDFVQRMQLPDTFPAKLPTPHGASEGTD